MDDDDFTRDLLTGDGKWWEFLDPQTYEVREDLPRATHSTSGELDWSRRKRPPGPVGFSFFNHCSVCGQGVPPDFTFCVHCGGAPRGARSARVYSIVVARFEQEGAREAATELIVKAGHGLEAAEVDALFDDLPAVFNLTARRDQIAALTAKLSEVGIAARGFSVDDPSVPWIRETTESVIRHTPKLVASLALLATGFALAWYWSVLGLVVTVGAVVGIFVHELRWYRSRYTVEAATLLQLLTGFDPETARVAQEALQMMSDREARGHVTVCLMEYYSLTQQLRAHSAVYGGVLRRTGEALEELMADVLVLAHRYAKLDDFLRANPPALLRQRLEELRQLSDTDAAAQAMTEAEITALTDQLESTIEMEQTRRAFRERLAALARSMESMRSRFAAVRAQPSEDAFRSMEFEEALRELEEEFDVFEQTLAVVG